MAEISIDQTTQAFELMLQDLQAFTKVLPCSRKLYTFFLVSATSNGYTGEQTKPTAAVLFPYKPSLPWMHLYVRNYRLI